MIEWIYGESGSGKTTLARKIVAASPGTVHLDGDDMRRIWPELTFTDADRMTNNVRIATLARILERQGLRVVVSTICPDIRIRAEVQRITGCTFIHIEGERDRKVWDEGEL